MIKGYRLFIKLSSSENLAKVCKTELLNAISKCNIQIPDHPYRILITRGSVLGKTNTLLNLINHQPDIGKIYLHV